MKLTDFGVARIQEPEESRWERLRNAVAAGGLAVIRTCCHAGYMNCWSSRPKASDRHVALADAVLRRGGASLRTPYELPAEGAPMGPTVAPAQGG